MAKKTIDEIVEEKLPTFANIIKEIRSSEEMKKNLIVYLRQKEDLIIQKNRDDELENLKKRKSEISKPYTQMIGALKKMTNCIYMFGHKFEGELKQKFEENLVEYAIQLSAIKRQKDENDELKAITEAISEINSEYGDTIKVLEMKCDYISFIMKERFDVESTGIEI
jgi:uncharacterized protein with gpF-like domain